MRNKSILKSLIDSWGIHFIKLAFILEKNKLAFILEKINLKSKITLAHLLGNY